MLNNAWQSLLSMILAMPGAKINRTEFLSDVFSKESPEMQRRIIDGPITSIVSVETLERISKRVIRMHTFKVTSLSALAGIPGGLAMLGTVPADIANFYYHTVSIGQKMGYLWGFPDMLDENGNMTDEGKVILTGFIGVMNKVEAAEKAIKAIAKDLAKRTAGETAERMAAKLIIKPVIAQSTEQVAKRLSLQIASNSSTKFINKFIPVISGVICGTMTYASFKSQAKKLNTNLRSIALKNNSSSHSFQD